MYRSPTILLVSALMLAMLSLWFQGSPVQARAMQAGSSERKTVWDGVYADDQASTGKAIYDEHCGTCHGATLGGGANQGAPPLKGDKFMENWREDHLESLYSKIKNTMPRRSDKALTERETLDVVSYVLRENSFPAGANELNSSVLSTIYIQRKDGPRPLPTNSLIQTVGCMAQEGDAWTLSTASQPIRVRTSEKTTPEELKAAESKPRGTLTFRLQNLIMLGAFKPESHNGHKMLAKGLLIKRANTEIISITELEMVSADCTQ